MIQILSILVTIWMYGIMIAALILGLIVSIMPTESQRSFKRIPYVFWCVAWPLAMIVILWRSSSSRWNR